MPVGYPRGDRGVPKLICRSAMDGAAPATAGAASRHVSSLTLPNGFCFPPDTTWNGIVVVAEAAPVAVHEDNMPVLRMENITKIYRRGLAEPVRAVNAANRQQQRVAIARALGGNRCLLLADEPTGALDSATAAEILDLICDRVAAGAAGVIVTHDRAVANRATRVIELRDGAVVGQGLPCPSH